MTSKNKSISFGRAEEFGIAGIQQYESQQNDQNNVP